MQDRLGDLRELALEINPSAHIRLDCSAVLDNGVNRRLRGEHQGFDIASRMGLRREDNSLDANFRTQQFMGAVFGKVDDIKVGIAAIRTSMDSITTLKQQAMQATSPEREREISKQLTKVLDESNRALLKIKADLEALKEENIAFAVKNPNSSEGRIRENMHAALARKFRAMLQEYQTLQTDYKQEMKEKVTRQVKIAFPEADNQELSRIIDEGDMSSAMAIRMRISGQAHENLQNALSDIHDKYRDIRRLEQSVQELHQLFVDLSTLVDAQGELLDQIEYSVNSAKDYTEKAEKELVVARKYQATAKKRACWVSVCVIVLAVLVMMPLIVILT